MSSVAQTVLLAEKAERVTSPLVNGASIRLVAFGHLVRARRMAAAVATLGPDFGHEARVLLRALIEGYYNYAWIRLEDAEARSNRYLRFHTLEKLNILECTPTAAQSQDHVAKVARLKADRESLSAMFRSERPGKKIGWATSWASVTSLEARMAQVRKAESAVDPRSEGFMYMLYRWFSGTVHGGPQSVKELLNLSSEAVSAKTTVEMSTGSSTAGAEIALLLVLRYALADLGASEAIVDEVEEHWQAVRKSVLAGEPGAAVCASSAGAL